MGQETRSASVFAWWLTGPPDVMLFQRTRISGSSDAGLAAAQRLGAVPVKYPEPPEQCTTQPQDQNRGCGIRVGIIAREKQDEAWQVADERFPPDREGQLMHKLAMKVSDFGMASNIIGSQWTRQRNA